jgi:Tfp pilus assembly protein PilO
MSALLTRETVAHLIIIMALSVGGWMMLVQPKVSEIQKLDRQIAEVSTDAAPINEAAVQEMADRVNDLKARITEIDARNRVAGDSSQLFATIMRLAREQNVTVVDLNPGQTTSHVSEIVGIMNIEMSLEGSYENIATFVARLQTEANYVRPTALRVMPMDRGRGKVVAARLGCQSLSFSLPPQVAALQGTSYGEE